MNNDTIPLFPIAIDKATQLYRAAEALGVTFATISWSPDKEVHAAEMRKLRPTYTTPENITIHPGYSDNPYLTDIQGRELEKLGFEGNQRAGYSYLIQKHDWWPRDTYAAMTEAEQVQVDLHWIEAGGWLSDSLLQRLEHHGHKVRS